MQFREQKWILGSAVWFLWICTWMNCTEKQKAGKTKVCKEDEKVNSVPFRRVSACMRWGMEMKLLPGKIKPHRFFHGATKQGVGKQGRRRETRVTWAGPGRGPGSRTALLVSERSGAGSSWCALVTGKLSCVGTSASGKR